MKEFYPKGQSVEEAFVRDAACGRHVRVRVHMCVCVNHLNRCKTSLVFIYNSMQGVAADHLGPLPTKTPT